ncbi:hypothetical protein, partial [Candidatus Thiosymbion oneisti]|uniref:hypothetical protein n=1 Tax=Candidatus Thiosymbion oneisti TaxID=589554 RepID=UPI001C4064D7
LECAGKAARPHRTSATGDTSGVGREFGYLGSPVPRRRRFPLAATPVLGTDARPNPKRRRVCATWPTPRLCPRP